MNLNPSSSATDFFVAGGTLSARAPSYVTRPADAQLLKAALAGKFCYVLTTRQMGKSSLMVRTADRLKEQGIRTAIVDLSGIGRSVEDTWYLDFLSVLADKLDLAQDVEAWWQAHAASSAVLRFRSFLRDVVLAEIEGQIVIFVDEIDSTLGLPFADDFFAAVRVIYNERADDAQFKRLTFIFLGVASPADLIKDRTRTPFNIGQGILLRDFDRAVATVLQQGLDAAYPGQGQAILDRIYDWTNGHPYLTQRLCREVVDQKRTEPWTPAEVDRVVNDLFLSNQTNREQNLQFAQDRVLKNPHRRELLKLYGKVSAGQAVVNDEQSVLQNQLKLAGLVATDDGKLRVHNKIYRSVFDVKWIGANTPRDNNRLMTYAAITMAVLVVGLAAFVVLYNSNMQHQSTQLQLEFTQVSTSVERLDRLAQLFNLRGVLDASDFDDTARRLFFDMNSRQDQLALFQVDDIRVVSVIEGLYTALAEVNNGDDNDALLIAMRDALQKIGTRVAEAPRLYDEINHWLRARQSARQNQYNYALPEYDKAIQANRDDSNPATHFERARVMLGLSSPVYSLVLKDLDAALGLARKMSEAKTGDSEPNTTLTPIPPPILTRTPPPTQALNSDTTATATVAAATHVFGPTASTTPAAGEQTSVPVPTATYQAQPPRPRTDLRPFRSQFISYVQIASAIRNLRDSSPELVAFLANSAESDYTNLRVAKLVPTLTPTLDAILAKQDNEVRAYFSMLTADHQPITGLTNDAIAVSLFGQPITAFDLSLSQDPMAIALVIDTSGSMSGQPLDLAKAAARQLIDTLGAQDEVSLFSFNQVVTNHTQNFTIDKGAIKNVIRALAVPKNGTGWTCLYDALYDAVTLAMKRPEGRRGAIVVLSDGGDNGPNRTQCSQHNVGDVIDKAQAARMPIYAIGLGQANGPVLDLFAAQTGGRALVSPTSADLAQSFQDIGHLLKDQYLLVFKTDQSGSGVLQIRLKSDPKVVNDVHITVINPDPLSTAGAPVTVTVVANSPTPTSTTSAPYYLSSLEIVSPADGSQFYGRDAVVLKWKPPIEVAALDLGQIYSIRISYRDWAGQSRTKQYTTIEEQLSLPFDDFFASGRPVAESGDYEWAVAVTNADSLESLNPWTAPPYSFQWLAEVRSEVTIVPTPPRATLSPSCPNGLFWNPVMGRCQ